MEPVGNHRQMNNAPTAQRMTKGKLTTPTEIYVDEME